jgi:carbonic anhydrase
VAFELAAIRSSLANLRTFPFIKKRMNEGLLALHGLHFDIASGALIELDEASDNFAALNEA